MKERDVENQHTRCKEAAAQLGDLEVARRVAVFPCVGGEMHIPRNQHAPLAPHPNSCSSNRTTSLEPVRRLENTLESYSRSHPNSQRSTDRMTPPWSPSTTPFDPARVPARSALLRSSCSSRSRLQRHTPPPTCSSPCSLSLSALSARAGCSLAAPLLSQFASHSHHYSKPGLVIDTSDTRTSSTLRAPCPTSSRFAPTPGGRVMLALAAGLVCGAHIARITSRDPETEAAVRGELHIVLIGVGVGAGNVRREGILRWRAGSRWGR
jgi:hypothetical protein